MAEPPTPRHFYTNRWYRQVVKDRFGKPAWTYGLAVLSGGKLQLSASMYLVLVGVSTGR